MTRREGSKVRAAILDATRGLLEEKRYDELTVADILLAAGVARGSFYLYFESKADVLADLVRRAIGQGHEAAGDWLGHDASNVEQTTRASIAAGARLWRAEAPVLRAIVENWRSNPKLEELWLSMMAGFTAGTTAGIADVRTAVDPGDLAAALTWLGERIYYLAALGVAPFDDEEKLVDVLTHIWVSSLYRS